MEKIKGFITSDKGKDISIVIIVIFVGLSSFLLGRLSVVSKSSGVKIVYPAGQSTDKIESQTATVLNGRAAALPFKTNTQSYFASSRGKKYYSSGCAAGKSIKVENRVYFASKAEAEKAGYELSSSCR